MLWCSEGDCSCCGCDGGDMLLLIEQLVESSFLLFY
jgi:hypothetical protein